MKATEADRARLADDLILLGNAFLTPEGKRIDPTTVWVYDCGQRLAGR